MTRLRTIELDAGTSAHRATEFTAIVLSAAPVTLQLGGVQVLPWVSRLKDDAALHAARLSALSKVSTPWCFFLDDDDELPENYPDVLGRVAEKFAQGAGMVYTDELVHDKGLTYVRSGGDYDNQRHQSAPMLLHHLVAMRTDAAQEVARTLPRGHYWTEHMLFYAIGRRHPVAYVPAIGYVWNRRADGFSRDPRMARATAMSMIWCASQGAPA